MIDYFPQSDFDKCVPPCKKRDMDEVFMGMLNEARELAGTAFIPTSAFRSVNWELSHQRDGKSSHTKGVAIDLKVTHSKQRFMIVDALLKVGFKRIGIGESFVHVDFDLDKSQRVIWTYY